MKKLAKVLSLALVLVMVLSLGGAAWADQVTRSETVNTKLEDTTTFSVTINKNETDKAAHSYGAYQIFKGDLAEVFNVTYQDDTYSHEISRTSTGNKTLSNIQWGDSIDRSKVAALINDLDGIDGITLAAGADAATVAKAIGDANLENDKDKAQRMADAFNKALNTTVSGIGEVTAAATSGTITGLKAGYYLIKDTADVSGEGAATRFILQVISNVSVEEKASVPSVTKKVKEKNDTTNTETGWQDGADYDIGDSVPFKLEGTLPTKFAEFDTYTVYKFIDTLSAGLTAPAAADVHVYLDTESGTEITELFDVEVNGMETAEQTLTVTLKSGKDLKLTQTLTDGSSVTFTKDSKIIVLYNATLNDSAVIGTPGNPNKVKLEFSNNPNYDGDGEKGTTPEDKVVVFTYEIKALKVKPTADAPIDQTTYNAWSEELKKDYVKVGDTWQKVVELEGAGFTLYKKVNDTFVQISNEITGVTTFEFKGTDAGEYKLVETTVPSGYNKVGDISFTVTATYDTEADDPKLKTLTVTPETAGFTVTTTTITGDEQHITTDGIITGKILNQKGNVLPSTGGVGTTLFYVFGSMLVIAAAVYFVTKKRSEVE